MKRRYAIVDLGHRAYTFLHALLGRHAGDGCLIGLCDGNPGRLERTANLTAAAGVPIPTYTADEFDRMVRETVPDRVVVMVPDRAHCDSIVRALERRTNVIAETLLVSRTMTG